MDKEALNLLRGLGLNQYESRLYLALLSSGSVTASDLSDLANIPRPRTYDVLNKLEKRGFVRIQPGRPTKFRAVSIDEAFENLKEKKKDGLEKEIGEIGQIQRNLTNRIRVLKPTEPKEAADFVWVLRDRKNIYSKMESLIREADRNVLIVTSDKGIERKMLAYGDTLKKAKARGIDVKIISPAETKHTRKASKFAEVIKKDHDQRFMIIDDHVLLFLTPEENEEKKEMGAWIKSPYFADRIRKLV